MIEIKELIAYKKATGKTKEQIAYEIGVSTFSVMRWFNINSCSPLSRRAIRAYLDKMQPEKENGKR